MMKNNQTEKLKRRTDMTSLKKQWEQTMINGKPKHDNFDYMLSLFNKVLSESYDIEFGANASKFEDFLNHFKDMFSNGDSTPTIITRQDVEKKYGNGQSQKKLDGTGPNGNEAGKNIQRKYNAPDASTNDINSEVTPCGRVIVKGSNRNNVQTGQSQKKLDGTGPNGNEAGKNIQRKYNTDMEISDVPSNDEVGERMPCGRYIFKKDDENNAYRKGDIVSVPTELSPTKELAGKNVYDLVVNGKNVYASKDFLEYVGSIDEDGEGGGDGGDGDGPLMTSTSSVKGYEMPFTQKVQKRKEPDFIGEKDIDEDGTDFSWVFSKVKDPKKKDQQGAISDKVRKMLRVHSPDLVK